MKECAVCYNTYNKSTRSKVACGKCQFECCKTCVRTYLLGTIKNAHCMNCNEEWERDFLVENLNSSFVNKKYKQHRSNILLDREKARFPETMPVVQRRVAAQDLTKENEKLNDEIYQIKLKVRQLENKRRQNAYQIGRILSGGNASAEEKKQHFHRACPADGCKGFLSTAYKCGLCKIWACPKCFEVIGYNKNDPHTCKEENLKTAEMLRKETKNCPGCAATIFKISGCDQMFCTQCKIAFSWKTGEIERGVIHNPHFYEWQRQAGHNIRNPREVPCGGIPDYWTFSSKIRRAVGKTCTEGEKNWTMTFHRQANHWQHWEIRTLRTSCRDLENNLELRVDYLMDRMEQKELMSKLTSREKSRNKKLKILHIYELMNTVFTESLIDIYNTLTSENIEKNYQRIKNLIDYSNKELARISYVYNQTVKLFNVKNFGLASKKFTKRSYNIFVGNVVCEPVNKKINVSNEMKSN